MICTLNSSRPFLRYMIKSALIFTICVSIINAMYFRLKVGEWRFLDTQLVIGSIINGLLFCSVLWAFHEYRGKR